jgi:hypothetical protein
MFAYSKPIFTSPSPVSTSTSASAKSLSDIFQRKMGLKLTSPNEDSPFVAVYVASALPNTTNLF